MNNPFVPGSKKIGVVSQGMSSKIVEIVAQGMGLDKSKIDLEKETKSMLDKSALAIKNHDHAGYLYYIQRGVFLSVYCGDFEIALQFAKEFLQVNNPGASNSIGVKEVSELAALYSAILANGGVDKIKNLGDEENTIRAAMLEKGKIHSASHLVARHARFNVHVEGDEDLNRARDFATMLFSIASQEPFQNPWKDNEISRISKASENETRSRYQKACSENTPRAYAGFAMQVLYDYCVFTNMGFFKVTALTDLLAQITDFAQEHNSTRLGDIPKMIEEDFHPNPQYGE